MTATPLLSSADAGVLTLVAMAVSTIPTTVTRSRRRRRRRSLPDPRLTLRSVASMGRTVIALHPLRPRPGAEDPRRSGPFIVQQRIRTRLRSGLRGQLGIEQAGQFTPTVDAELGERPLEVGLGGPDRDPQRVGDVLVGLAGGRSRGDVEL